MEYIYTTELLESETSKGYKKFWQGHIAEDNGQYLTLTSYWQETANGLSKMTTSAPTLIKGKNIGKANETTDLEQAHFETKSAVNKQRDKGYHLEGEVTETLTLPMLCQKFKDSKHRLTGELAVQPKFDGMRACWDSKRQVMWSRAGKPQIPQIYSHLAFDTQGYIADGELILPKPYTFEQTMSAAKKFREELSPQLQYHIFDIVDPTGELSFAERHAIAKQIVEEAKNPNVILVPTFAIRNIDSVMEWQDKFVELGYEGIIIRMIDGKYKPGNRGKSHEIQKFKYFIDEEYKVIGIEGGSGKNENLAAFICIDKKSGENFRVEFNGTDEKRTYMFNHPEEFIGRMLNVKFQEYNASGVPRFGKGTWFRDYDLQGGGEDGE